MLGLTPDSRHGPLPALLVLLTISTGLVDAVSFLRLGHLFVANMTGNVVFLAFALGGATEFSVPASSTALASFLIGAWAGGRLAERLATHRGRHLATTCAVQALLVGAAWLISLLVKHGAQQSPTAMMNLATIGFLGSAMGIQNATVRRIGVPGLTTTVMTMTITGIAADWGIDPASSTPRLLGVTMLFLGAAVGAVVVLYRGVSSALAIALCLLVTTSLVSYSLSRSAPDWVKPPKAMT